MLYTKVYFLDRLFVYQRVDIMLVFALLIVYVVWVITKNYQLNYCFGKLRHL